MQSLQEFVQDAIDSNVLWEVMGWDLKHGPTLEELEAFELLLNRFKN